MNQEGEGTRRLQSLLELSLEIVTLKMITLALHKSFVTEVLPALSPLSGVVLSSR